MYRIVVLSHLTESWNTAFKDFYDELKSFSGISWKNDVPFLNDQKTIEDVRMLAEKYKIRIDIVRDDRASC